MNKWISVNDRLPELVKTKYGHSESAMVPVKFKWDRDNEYGEGWRRG